MERVERGVMWRECGAQGKLKNRPRVFWGLCICARTWWEPTPLAILFYVGPHHGNMVPNLDTMVCALRDQCLNNAGLPMWSCLNHDH
ncbi:unnamed protein product [Sphenostylis stenocarpa]|uniref:Uncharacterized protein n=1 Tax=Sphenostylis stenocarpa TaxID=92480 RepID=A0AA86S529_9FABA|nr:unnamed protein product [Sphenostylis stenocarpa]